MEMEKKCLVRSRGYVARGRREEMRMKKVWITGKSLDIKSNHEGKWREDIL